MPDQNQPKAPAFNPKLKDAIVALKAENNPKNLNAVLNELVRSPLLAPANFDLQGQSAPTPGPDGRVQLPPNTKINLIMVNSPEGKHYYLASVIGTLYMHGRRNRSRAARLSCCALMISPIWSRRTQMPPV